MLNRIDFETNQHAEKKERDQDNDITVGRSFVRLVALL